MKDKSDIANVFIRTRSTLLDSSLPRLLKGDEKAQLIGFLSKYYGMDERDFNSYDVYAYSRQAFLFWGQEKGFQLPKGHFMRCGLPFLRNVAGFLKPTTAFIQRFGHLATRNILEIGLDELINLCATGEISIKKIDDDIITPSYVIIRVNENIFGVSLLLEDLRLVCRFPKALKEAIIRLRLNNCQVP